MRHVSEAVGRGGRLGTIEALSGSYEHDVRIPGMKAKGVTPEELLAGAWVACFGMTFIEAARRRDIDATDVEYKAAVVLEASNGEYTITEARLDVDAPDIDPGVRDALIEHTHLHCPVSKLLRAGVAALHVASGSAAVEAASPRRSDG